MGFSQSLYSKTDGQTCFFANVSSVEKSRERNRNKQMRLRQNAFNRERKKIFEEEQFLLLTEKFNELKEEYLQGRNTPLLGREWKTIRRLYQMAQSRNDQRIIEEIKKALPQKLIQLLEHPPAEVLELNKKIKSLRRFALNNVLFSDQAKKALLKEKGKANEILQVILERLSDESKEVDTERNSISVLPLINNNRVIVYRWRAGIIEVIDIVKYRDDIIKRLKENPKYNEVDSFCNFQDSELSRLLDLLIVKTRVVKKEDFVLVNSSNEAKPQVGQFYEVPINEKAVLKINEKNKDKMPADIFDRIIRRLTNPHILKDYLTKEKIEFIFERELPGHDQYRSHVLMTLDEVNNERVFEVKDYNEKKIDISEVSRHQERPTLITTLLGEKEVTLEIADYIEEKLFVKHDLTIEDIRYLFDHPLDLPSAERKKTIRTSNGGLLEVSYIPRFGFLEDGRLVYFMFAPMENNDNARFKLITAFTPNRRFWRRTGYDLYIDYIEQRISGLQNSSHPLTLTNLSSELI